MWLRKGKALEEDTESEEVKEAKKLKEEEEAKVRMKSFVTNRMLTIVTPAPTENASRAAIKIRHDNRRSAARMSFVFR